MLTLGCSVMETVNHLLYTRNQIPMPLAMLRQVIAKREKTSQPLRPGGKQIGRMKRDNTIKNLSIISSAIRDVFSTCRVNCVVLVLGSTIVSPKETFLISIGTDVYEGTDPLVDSSHSDVLNPNGAVVRRFLRDVVTNENLNELPSLSSLQNIQILLNLEVTCKLNDELSEIFVPKMNFHLSTRGSFHSFHLTSTLNEPMLDWQSILVRCNENSTKGLWYASKLPMKGFKE